MLKSRKKVPRLTTVMRYKNERLVSRFSAEYGFSQKMTETIFDDFKRFMWLSDRFRKLQPSDCGLKSFDCLDYWQPIDEMWHCFLQLTEDYMNFSREYFGSYMHHTPTAQESKTSLTEAELDSYLNLVYDEFGPKVTNRWFRTYPLKYNLQSLLMRKLDVLKRAKRSGGRSRRTVLTSKKAN